MNKKNYNTYDYFEKSLQNQRGRGQAHKFIFIYRCDLEYDLVMTLTYVVTLSVILLSHPIPIESSPVT